MGDLRVAHNEHIAEDGMQRAAILSSRAHVAFRDDDVVFFDQARDADRRMAGKRLPFDLAIEVALPSRMECPRYQPFDVFREARQYFRVICSVERIHVLLNGLLI